MGRGNVDYGKMNACSVTSHSLQEIGLRLMQVGIKIGVFLPLQSKGTLCGETDKVTIETPNSLPIS